MPTSTVKTRTAEFSVDANKILHITMLPDVLIDELDVYDNNLVVRNLSHGKNLFRLIDSRAKDWSMTDGAKKIIEEKIAPEKGISRAILVNTGIGKHVLNVLKLFKSQNGPVKYFTSYEEAIKWLLSLEK